MRWTVSPRLLDGCCKGGGASVGYHRAGFVVWGADIELQKAYPFTFVKADIRELLADRKFMATFDAIHVSPPCQENSRTQHLRDAQGGQVKENGEDIIAEVRELCEATALPYVLENVEGSSLRPDLTLCGTQFGLHVMRGNRYRPLKRHRVFEANRELLGFPPKPCDHALGRPLGVYGSPKDDIPAGGQTASSVREAGELMGIDWMTPPAYTEHIGGLLMDRLIAARSVLRASDLSGAAS